MLSRSHNAYIRKLVEADYPLAANSQEKKKT